MEEALYLDDSYLAECTSKVRMAKEGGLVFLDRTVFYPRGGGQPCDTGKIVRASDGKEFQVKSVFKEEGGIAHEILPTDGSLCEGDEVKCSIDWERRYRLMRMHTAGHVLSAIMYKNGMQITGNQLGTDKSRFDFPMENFDKEAFGRLVEEANAAIARNLDVKVYYISREEAMKIEGAVKLAAALPPSIPRLRMVKIGDIDLQADGGTHVKNTSEIGRIVFLGAENKGKSNRRIYFGLDP
jgi:Ser-tRNA(Ala) deacylase AlaX